MRSALAIARLVSAVGLYAILAFGSSYAAPAPDSSAEDDGCVTYEPAPSKKVRAIERVLDRTVEFELERMPLTEAVEELRKRSGLPLEIDRASLRRDRIPLDVPIAVAGKGVPLGDALATALRRVRLAYTLDDDRLLVTSFANATDRLIARRYRLSPLVWTKLEPAELLETIQQELPDAEWQAIEGVGGTIKIDPKTGSIEVRQTYIAHQKIRRLLEGLHRE